MTSEKVDPAVYTERLARAGRLAAEAGLAAVIVGTGPDLRYLTGATAETHERFTGLVIPATGLPWLVVARLERAAIAASPIPTLGIEIRDWVDGDDPYALALAGLPAAPAIAVSESLPALHLVPLADRLGVTPALATPVLRELRMIKDAAEVAALQRAAAAIDRVHARVGEWLRPGRTEAAVAADITEAIVAEGHTEAAFVIVGSGPNGADPHHDFSDRVITDGDVVVIDIGGPEPTGYHSDSTRTYRIGEVDPAVTEAYRVLEEAQAAAVAAVRPGATAEAVDAAARDHLAAAGLADRFIHRTGHGIGLSVHEEPYIVTGNELTLRPGMAFSVEPGIYLAGAWGARIEDIVMVTEDGCEVLNRRPRGLIEPPTDG